MFNKHNFFVGLSDLRTTLDGHRHESVQSDAANVTSEQNQVLT